MLQISKIDIRPLSQIDIRHLNTEELLDVYQRLQSVLSLPSGVITGAVAKSVQDTLLRTRAEIQRRKKSDDK